MVTAIPPSFIEFECDVTTAFQQALWKWLPDGRSHKACGNGILWQIMPPQWSTRWSDIRTIPIVDWGEINFRRFYQYLFGGVPSPKLLPSPHLSTFIDQCDVLERSLGPKALPIHQLDMAVIAVLVDLEFCTKSDCESVRFSRNFFRKISVNTKIFTNWFWNRYSTNPTKFTNLTLLFSKRTKMTKMTKF